MITIRFGRVMDQEEMSNRISELSPEQHQAIVQLIQSNVEDIGSVIDGPKLDPGERLHMAGGLYWSRTLLEKYNALRSPSRGREVLEPLVEI